MTEREHWTNFRTTVFATGLTLIVAAFGAQIGNWQHWITIGAGYGVGIMLMLIATTFIAKSYFSEETEHIADSTPQISGVMQGIPTLSALLGKDTGMNFDAKKFFALAYYSPVTAETEKNFRIIAQQNSPNDKEGFYARLIGVGVIAFQHDHTWLLIFGSQLRAMTEMSSRGLIPLADLKKHYDKAVVDYPNSYKNYSFEEWVEFMKFRSLIATYPTQMVELSFGGQDFLKYLAHFGRGFDKKPN